MYIFHSKREIGHQLYQKISPVDEFEGGHVRSTPGTIDCEEAQAGAVQAVKMVESVGQQLAGLLGGGIWGHGLLHSVGLLQNLLRAAAIHTRRRRVYEVFAAVLTSHVEQTSCAFYIAVNVDVRINNRSSHACSSSQVANMSGPLFLEDATYKIQVAYIYIEGNIKQVER